MLFVLSPETLIKEEVYEWGGPLQLRNNLLDGKTAYVKTDSTIHSTLV